MSKVIEALRASAREFSRNQDPKSESLSQSKSEHELTQEQLADIYFSSADKRKQSEYPLIVKVIEKQVRGSWAPWVIACLALALASFSLFSTKRIFVDIRVMDEKTLPANFTGYEREPNVAEVQEAAPRSKGLKDNGVYSEQLVTDRFTFEGAAKLKSSKDSSELTLVNSSIAPFARASITFEKPISLVGTKIVFYAKGQKGGENLAIAIKDRDNVLAFDKGKFMPFAEGLTGDWQKAEISLANTAIGFDPENVQTLRFEFGTKDTQNKSGDTVFVKDLQAVLI